MKKKLILLCVFALFSAGAFAQNILQAAKTNDIAGIKFLLNNGANIDARDTHGATPLIIAIKNNQDRVAGLLIEKDASIDLQDNAGNTALITAINKCDKAMVKTLLAHGANAKLANIRHRSAIDYAKAAKDQEILAMLTTAQG